MNIYRIAHDDTIPNIYAFYKKKVQLKKYDFQHFYQKLSF